MPGAQLANRVRELGYAPREVDSLEEFQRLASSVRPLFALVDLNWDHGDVTDALHQLRADAATSHLPVLAFSLRSAPALDDAAIAAGATLVAAGDSIPKQMPDLIERLLQVD